jgi:homoserine acetyltransferase
MLETLTISAFTTLSGVQLEPFPLSFECFGKPLGEAPLILVNHALTANSTLTGQNGWWNEIVGPDRAVDTNRALFCVLIFQGTATIISFLTMLFN